MRQCERQVSHRPLPKNTEKREQLRKRLFERQDGLCHLCGGPMTLLRKRHNVGRFFATFDHVLPRSDGGTAHISNLKLAHRKCNNARNSKPLELLARASACP